MARIIITFLACLFCGELIAQSGTFQASLSEKVFFDQSTPYSEAQLRRTLLNLLNRSHAVSLSTQTDVLVIIPYTTTITKDVTPTVPPMISYDLELKLSIINVFDNTVYHSDFFELKGIGRTENKAYGNAFNQLRRYQKRVDNFLVEAENKVNSYYETNCSRIINESMKDAELDLYTEAFNRLASVPTFVHCQAEVSKQMISVYNKQKDLHCKKFLNVAEAAISIRNYWQAADAISQINPESKCYEAAKALKDEIKQQTGDIFEKWWSRGDKLVDKYAEIQKAKYQAYGSMGAAIIDSNSRYNNGSNTGNFNNSGRSESGGGAVVVNNNNSNTTTINSPGKSNSTNSGGAKKESNAPQTLFRIVSPASRSSNGEVVAY